MRNQGDGDGAKGSAGLAPHQQMLRELLAARSKYNSHAVAMASLLMGAGVQVRSHGSHVESEGGKKHLDLFDAYGNQAFGYSHPKLVSLLLRVIETGKINSCKIFFDPPQIQLAERLAQLTDGRLTRSFLANGGAEAIDSALKLARAATRRRTFVTAQGCFHGKTWAALSAACRPEYEEIYGPLLGDFRAVPFGDLAAMEAAIGPDTAAVLIEPIQAEGGINVADARYFHELRRLCQKRGALLIFDEMQTAFGRTGQFFAYQLYDVLPDIVCIGKSFGGGIIPISAVLARQDLWEQADRIPLSFGSSLGGNPLACAVGLETIAMASEPQFLAHVRAAGDLVSQRLATLKTKHPRVVADCRGVGLLHGIEFHHPAVAGHVAWLLNVRGVLTAFCLYNPSVLRVEPPLVMEIDALTTALDALESAIAEADATMAQAEPSALHESRLVLSRQVAAPPRAVFARAAESMGFLLLTPLVRRALPVREGEVQIWAELDGIPLEWTDHIEMDPLAGKVVQRAVDGDWPSFCRSFRLTPTDRGTRLDLEVIWDAGTGDFETVMRLRLRAALERAFVETLNRIANSVA
jgi:putrescine aminotransferase